MQSSPWKVNTDHYLMKMNLSDHIYPMVQYSVLARRFSTLPISTRTKLSICHGVSVTRSEPNLTNMGDSAWQIQAVKLAHVGPKLY